MNYEEIKSELITQVVENYKVTQISKIACLLQTVIELLDNKNIVSKEEIEKTFGKVSEIHMGQVAEEAKNYINTMSNAELIMRAAGLVGIKEDTK